MIAMYAIYDHPLDYPDNFVVRKWVVGAGVMAASVNGYTVTDTLEEARATVPDGHMRHTTASPGTIPSSSRSGSEEQEVR